MPTSIQEIGIILGKKSREQSQIKENLSPDEFASQLVTFNQFGVDVSGEATINKQVLTSVLTVGHPVYGEVFSYPIYVPMILGHPVWGVLGSGYLSSSVEYSSTFIESSTY